MTTPTDPITSSRRAVLAGLAGGAAAAVAGSLGRPQPVAATHGDVHLGEANSAIAPTSITNTAADGLAIEGKGTGTGVGVGVRGSSTSGLGIIAVTSSASWAALRALSSNGSAAVQGYSGGNPVQSGPTNVGVFGSAATDANSYGVHGFTNAGRGVMGSASSGTGIYGEAANGEGVRGVSTDSNGVGGTTASGIASGVYGENTGGGFGTYGRSHATTGVGVFGESIAGTAVKGSTVSGVAIEAAGRVKFSTAGLLAVPAGARQATITPGVDLVPASTILTTLESNQAGLFIHRVTKNAEANTFKVFLSSAVASGKYARIGWFVIG